MNAIKRSLIRFNHEPWGRNRLFGCALIAVIAIALILTSALVAKGQTGMGLLIDGKKLKVNPVKLPGSSEDLDEYVITFPDPNHCVVLGPQRAENRMEAMLLLVSKGGFTLKPNPVPSFLTVWTLDEYRNAMKKIDQMSPGWWERSCPGVQRVPSK